MLTADENQADGGGGNQQNIGSRVSISGVDAQNVEGNAQVGGNGAQFGGKREIRMSYTCRILVINHPKKFTAKGNKYVNLLNLSNL